MTCPRCGAPCEKAGTNKPPAVPRVHMECTKCDWGCCYDHADLEPIKK